MKKELLKDASVRTHFTDLNMPIPGEEQFAAQLAQLNGVGFYDDRLNLDVLREAGGDVQVAIGLLAVV